MRIIAGKHRSRILQTRSGDETRPTLDKVKEAFFSSIGPYFDGGFALDLFAGSGAIGLETLSRGMEKCIFVDASFDAIKIIETNIKALKEENNTQCWRMDYQRALSQCATKQMKFDFIFIDPPYSKVAIHQLLEFIDEKQLLNEDGYCVVETVKDDVSYDQYKSMYLKKEAIYGITKIAIYKWKEVK